MQLLYPWFLLALLAVSIPVIIHLLQLRRPQRMVFTNAVVIQYIELINTRHRKVQDLLILLVRVVAIGALVLSFCQPLLIASKQLLVSTNIEVLVDNSFSMQRPGVKFGTLFNEAIDGAQQLANATAAKERLRLLNSGRTSLTKVDFVSRLENLHLVAGGNVGKVALSFGFDNGANTSYVISDFQKNDFITSAFQHWPLAKHVVLIPVNGPATGNVYVDSVWVDDGFVRVKTNVGLHFRLRNGGEATVTDCPVKVFLGDRQVAAFRVTVAPGQILTSVVQVQLTDSSLALGRVVTEDASVTFDNTFFFTLRPAAAIQILEIGDEPVAQQVYGDEPLFAYRFARTQSIDYGLLRRANLVLIHQVPTVDAGLRDALEAVVKRGGSVVVVPTPAMAAHISYQLLFRQLGLGIVQWEKETANPELRDIAMPSAQEPFFRDVFGPQKRAATMPRVAPVLRWARTGTDILKLRDGDSYLAAFASGAGRVFVFAAPFDKRYSEFTSQALFVPVMYRMAMLSYHYEQQASYRVAQGSVSLTLPVMAGSVGGRVDEAGFQLVKDSVTFVPGQRVVGQEVRLAVPPGMNTPGFYQVRKQGKVLTTLAFNQDKRESELAAYSAAELREMIGPNRPNVRVLDGNDIGAGLAKLRAQQTGTPMWRYCLLLTLLALLAEAVLIRFSRRPVQATRATGAA